ncbi:hypothetical protein KJ603_00810, partial [Patescibacteria group bacterium]|nr:hypothetical protein [Patescibacteria group bacterium]
NIHSDALLNVIALVIFIIISGKWAYISAINYGWFSFLIFFSKFYLFFKIFYPRKYSLIKENTSNRKRNTYKT